MKAQLLFEPRDLWVGVYWDRRPTGLVVYLCLVPLLPLRLLFPVRLPGRGRPPELQLTLAQSAPSYRAPKLVVKLGPPLPGSPELYLWRRRDVQQQTPAEQAIHAAMAAVEAAGAHPLLTEAVLLLSQAFEKVADHTDGAGAVPVPPG